MDGLKVVDHSKYCKECEHWEKKENEDPCGKCLCASLSDTRVPAYFKEAKAK